MCVCRVVLISLIVYSVEATNEHFPKDIEETLMDKVIMDCLNSHERLICFSEKIARAVERSMDLDVPLFDGIKMVRNEEKVNHRTAKSLKGFDRLSEAVSNFIESHKVSVNFTELEGVAEARKGGGGGGGGGQGGGGEGEGGNSGGGGGKGGIKGGGGSHFGGGGLFSVGKKDLKKEKKYYRYAFMVLLGIFGLTGPLVMKVLGIAAAHSLLAAKAALIIVGGVALKKLFERDDHKKPKIKVHTVSAHDSEEQDYDRMSYGYNHIPYGYNSYGYTNHPYSAYASNDFAPILYGTPYDSKKASVSR